MHRLVFIGCLVIATLVAGLVAISRLAQMPDSDSLLFSIISLQHLTPYYWGQNRVGSLLPILFSPVRSIEVNFFLQTFCRAFAAALTPVFLIVILRPRIPRLLSFAASLGLIFVLMRDGALRSYWLDGSPYALALLFCAISAQIVLSSPAPSYWRICGAVTPALIASWISISIVVVSAPLFAVLAVLQRSRNYGTLFAISIGCFVLESVHSRLYGSMSYHGMMFSPYEQMAGLINAMRESVDPTRSAVAVLVLAALLIPATPMRRVGAWTLCHLLLACLVSVLVTAATNWFAVNSYHPRYLSLPVSLAIGGVGIWIAQLTYEALNAKLRPFLTPAVALVMVVICVHAVQPRLPQTVIAPSGETLADRAMRADIHLIAGDYWTTWPVVFELIRLRQSDDTYGLTERGEVMLGDIRASLTRDPRVLCVYPSHEICRQLLVAFTGSEFYRGTSMTEAMTAIETKTDPYSVLYELR